MNCKLTIHTLAISLTLMGQALVVNADNEKPAFIVHANNDGTAFTSMAANGKWGLTSPIYPEATGGTTIYNFDTNATTTFNVDGFTAGIISDDGNVVYGSSVGKAAYYNRTTNTTVTLPLPTGYKSSSISGVTADGHYAVGTARLTADADCMVECGVMWDLSTNSIVSLPNIPTKDMLHEELNQCRFTGISNDGHYIFGILSFSYIGSMEGPNCCCFIYNTQTNEPTFIGFTPSDTAPWTPLAEDLYYISDGYISPNGKWVAGSAYVTTDAEYLCSYLYNTETNEFQLYNNQPQDANMSAFAVDNEGIVYSATPAESPLREWYVRHDGYWYSFAQILQQGFDIKFSSTTHLDNTGTPIGVSADGSRFAVICDPQVGESYFVDMHQPIAGLCNYVNLLGNYSIAPVSGSTFTKLKEITITFDRDVQVIGSAANILLKDSNGATVRAASAIQVKTADNKAVLISFRTQTLAANETYTIEIPAGMISIANDNTKVNRAITLTYTGRADQPIAVTNIYPANNASMSVFDYNSSPVLITFDVPVAVSSTAAARLENADDNTKICDLNFAYLDNTIAVFPATAQNLFLGTNYRVVVESGSVTDVAGYGGNEEISIMYEGCYVRVLSPDGENLFSENFNNISAALVNMLRYEGDHLTPVEAMTAMEFDADNQPWNFSITDDDQTDYCAASHSMYTPAGKSDDWMVTPQLHITDETVELSFDAQSYLSTKDDYLKVYVWECDNQYNSLSNSIMDMLKAEATLVFNEKLTPGNSETTLAGDWQHYTISLEQFADKNVYIAFLNDNENQSIVFVDNIQVSRSIKYLLSLITPESVVQQESVPVQGIVTITSETDKFSSITLTLLNSTNEEIDKIVGGDDILLEKDDTYEFCFTNPLPLQQGEENTYSIVIDLDDLHEVVTCTVKDLSFRPVKRAVLEEFTGTTCPNCPQGILAIEKLQEAYGKQFIPISIHTYSNDKLGTGLTSYTSTLGLTAAPSAIVNRNGEISFPMWTNPFTGKAEFSNSYNLWADYMAEEMAKPADADFDISVEWNKQNNTFNIPMKLKYALNAPSVNLNVFIVVMEDGVIDIQHNNFAANSDPALGEWGLGGRYAQSIVYNYTHNDVVRAFFGNLPNGMGGYWDNTLVAGAEYSNTILGIDVPDNIDNVNLAKVCVMLIDANTGRLINAALAHFNPEYSGIEEVQNAECKQHDIYTISGMKVQGSPKSGLYIIDGKKTVIK